MNIAGDVYPASIGTDSPEVAGSFCGEQSQPAIALACLRACNSRPEVRNA